ncbi:MAG: hypothetical protein P4L42_14625, partial [Desulfocapsaceae bacterium]|nr:hypothetical protein [Desulfocapsaceae bacterium]
SNVSLKARSYLATVESYVGTLEATLNTIANPANSLISIISYGTSLPGRVIGAVARCLERYALLYATQQSAPARFIDSMIAGTGALTQSSGSFQKTTNIAAAGYIALQTAYLYKADETLRDAQKKNEGLQAFDALGNYTPPDPPDPSLPDVPMTVNELEGSLAAVRTCLQAAVNLSRQSASLKKQALQLQTHVNSIKLEREKMMQVQLDNPMPLHLVCLKYGLSYTAAERLLAINSIRNPNCTAGEVNVYAA